VRSGAVVGLDEAAGPGYVVAFSSDAWPTNPRPEVVTRIVAEPVLQFFALYEDHLKITVTAASVVGLYETDIGSGISQSFPVPVSFSANPTIAMAGGGDGNPARLVECVTRPVLKSAGATRYPHASAARS
jgi:hypothetical protein